jgi:glutathione-dependent peroxiredoxin
MPLNLHPRAEGEAVPDVSLRMRKNDAWVDVRTGELFAGRTIVVFSLPGAYTPTCSSTHLPRYNELAPQFRRAGVDRIVCIAVNDPFVMCQWGRDQEASEIMLLPDGNGEFTEQMGMLVDKGDLNFGKRSWRYSMLVRDGRIEKMFIEPDQAGDPFEVSDADTMLDHLDPGAGRPQRVAIFTREGCEHCARAKQLLRDADLGFAEIPLPAAIRSQALGAITGEGTVPQVFIDGQLIGGAEQLEAHLAAARR